MPARSSRTFVLGLKSRAWWPKTTTHGWDRPVYPPATPHRYTAGHARQRTCAAWRAARLARNLQCCSFKSPSITLFSRLG